MGNPVSRQIREILLPELGEPITDSVLRVICERIGTTPEKLTRSQTPEFVKNLKITLTLFFNEENVKALTQKIVNIK
jgi:hypothetical protein